MYEKKNVYFNLLPQDYFVYYPKRVCVPKISLRSTLKFRGRDDLNEKCIFCLKKYMFQDQYTLNVAEKQSIAEFSRFVGLIYKCTGTRPHWQKEVL